MLTLRAILITLARYLVIWLFGAALLVGYLAIDTNGFTKPPPWWAFHDYSPTKS